MKAYDIALLPNKSLSQEAVKLSSKLSPHVTLYMLGDSTNVPHISLYMAQFNDDAIGEVVGHLSSVAAKTTGFQLSSLRYNQSFGYIDVEYNNTVELRSLQDEFVAITNPLRTGILPSDKLIMIASTGLKLKNFEQYGYPAIGKLFRPHLTLTRFSDNKSIDEALLPTHGRFDGTFSQLALCELGDNGTCSKVLSTYDLL